MSDPIIAQFLSRLRMIKEGIENGNMPMANDEKWYLGRVYLNKRFSFRRDYPNTAPLLDEIVNTPEITAENAPRLLPIVDEIVRVLSKL